MEVYLTGPNFDMGLSSYMASLRFLQLITEICFHRLLGCLMMQYQLLGMLNEVEK